MKYLSRLTALLLALVLLFSSSVGSIAEANLSDLTRSSYDQMVLAAQEAAEAEAAAAAKEAASQPIINEGGVVYEQDIPEQTKRFDIYEVISDKQLSMGGETDVTLPQSGKINLSAGTAAQWQIYIPGADMWVNIAGETGDTFALTYAVIGGMLSGGTAKVRALAGDSAAVANVSVAYGSALPPVEEEDTFVAEAAAASTFALRRSASTSDANAGIMLAAEEHVTYNVVVNYVFENNEIVADPYTANLAAGSNFSATVNFPVVQGYLPYLGTATTSTTSLPLNITNIQADQTYTVTYRPTNVNYTVIHYQQNVDNDNYTIAETEVLQGLTKTPVPEVANSYAGFYALLYEKPAIAADGSTIVEIYYDRYYYLMNFELAGGYGVEPVYARFDAPVGTIGTPTRPGYSFAGWVDANGNAVTIPSKMPDGKVTYTATWTPGTTSYSVVYWFENADSTDANNPDNYSAVHVETIENVTTESKAYSTNMTDISSLGNTVVNGLVEAPKHFERYTNAALQSEYTVEGDGSTIVNVYYTRKEYTIRFYYARANSRDRNRIYVNRSTTGQTLSNSTWEKPGGTNTTTPPVVKPEYQSMMGTQVIGNYTYYYLDLTAKYNADITDMWPADVFDYSSTGGTYHGWIQNSWAIHPDSPYYDVAGSTKTFKGVYSRLDDNLIITDTNDPYVDVDGGKPVNYFMLYWRDPSYNYLYYIFYEAIDGETIPEGTTTYTYEGKTYILQQTIPTRSGSGVDGQNAPGYVGVKNVSAKRDVGGSGSSTSDPRKIYFFYERENYDLMFMSNGEEVKKESVPFGAQLGKYDFMPTNAPANTEFAGWYTTEACVEGTEFNFANETMPEHGVILYAKWRPISCTVEFYLDEAALNAGTQLGSHQPQTVLYGTKLGTVANPANGSYTFVGWFYEEDGVEKAFDFANMPVTKDMKVYGKWSSNVLKNYFVYFRLKGTETNVAAPITGSGLAGSTKTFDAKGGSDLYANYQEGYFPLVKSHSMTLDIDNDSKNIFTFEYVKKDAVPYTVYYVSEQQPDTNLGTVTLNGKTYYLVAETKTVGENKKAVVTETFKQVSGYMPDAYQKRLVVDGTDGAVNQIIFYYTKDTEHAYYQITHYTQNTDGTTWTEYASSQAMGDINTAYSADPLTIDGFTYKPDISTPSGTLTAAGLELKLYYVRNEYPYQVRYLKEGTGEVLSAPKNGKGLYGEVISESAIDIDNYTAVDPTSQTLTIKVEESQTEAKLNIITFYYTENTVPINYIPVGPDNQELTGNELTEIGSVSPTTENVKIITGVAGGSTATLHGGPTYKFVGWYSDAACTKLVSTNAAYVPQQPGRTLAEDGTVVNGEWPETTTYYAKFDWDVGKLKITKSGMENDESAIFAVKLTTASGAEKTWNVVLNAANPSVTLANLEANAAYEVTEVGNWSKLYSVTESSNLSGTIPGGGVATATIENQRTDKWLNDESSAKNVFNAVSVTE